MIKGIASRNWNWPKTKDKMNPCILLTENNTHKGIKNSAGEIRSDRNHLSYHEISTFFINLPEILD